MSPKPPGLVAADAGLRRVESVWRPVRMVVNAAERHRCRRSVLSHHVILLFTLAVITKAGAARFAFRHNMGAQRRAEDHHVEAEPERGRRSIDVRCQRHGPATGLRVSAGAGLSAARAKSSQPDAQDRWMNRHRRRTSLCASVRGQHLFVPV